MHRRPDGSLIVSATDLVGFLECGHLSALDMAVANGQLEKPHFTDTTLDLIRDRGGRHEGRYIEQLEAEGRTITRFDEDRKRPYEERAAETVEAMRRGDDVIYQATVFDDKWVGHPDFLLRVGDPGVLGTDHHYEVADTKLAHSAKASALIQICSYVDQIERIQGVRPEKVYVVTGGAEIGNHAFRTAEMMAYYRHAKQRFEQALDGLDHTKSYPDPVEHCGVCRWSVECRRRWHADDALPIVAGITRSQRVELGTLGIETRGALGSAIVESRAGNFPAAQAALAGVAKRIRGYAGRDKEMRALIHELEGEASVLAAPMPEHARKAMHFASYASARSRNFDGSALRKPQR